MGIVNHAQGTWNAITHPIETAKTAMAVQRPGSPENLQATIGMVKAANALVNGNGFERGEVMGGMAAGLVEGAVLTKGAGALMRTGTAPVLAVATEGATVSTTEQVVYRTLSTTDRAAVDAGKSLAPKGSGGTILDHVRGKPTGYISASETIEGTARFNSGNGMVAIDVNKAMAGGAGFVPHGNVMQAAKHLPKQGMKVGQAGEVLFDGSIAPNAYRLMDR